MKLAWKFTLCFLILMAVVRGYSTYLRMEREIELFEQTSLHEHEVSGRDLAHAVVKFWRKEGETSALQYIEEINDRKSEQTIRWIWAEGPFEAAIRAAALPYEGHAEGGYGEPVSVFIKAPDRRLITHIPVTAPDGRLGAIELSQSLEDGYKYVRISVLRSLITMAAIVVLTGIMAMVLGFIFVGRPVQRLIGAARRVASGDFSARIELRQSDELAELATELNAMCAQLAEADQRIAAETSAHQNTAARLRHADRLTTVGRLASGLAHELGTPLNVVLARARMIITREVEGEQLHNSARIIVEQSDRMSKIIRQLLDFARRRSPRRVSISLDHIARQTVSLLVPMAREHGVNLSFAACSEDAIVWVDPDQIQQVLSNLILNGMQAMPSGGNLTVGIRRSTEPPADKVPESSSTNLCVYVQDEGIGIPEQDLPNVFEPFFTTKGMSQGTGLGLSIAAEIVREHGGWISIDSRVGGGSCFTVHFPEETNACVAAS